MGRRGMKGIGWTVAVIAAASLLGTARGEGPTPSYEVRGIVVDQEQAAVTSVIVSLEGTDVAGETDANGSFVLTDVPAGTYTLSVRRACLVTGAVEGLRIPRPLRVPLPVIAYRWEGTPGALTPPLTPSDQGTLLTMALELAVPKDRVQLLEALLRDHALALRLENGALDSITLPGGLEEPLLSGPADAPGQAPVEVVMAFARPDARTALVRMTVLGAPSGGDLPVSLADRSLFLFRRDPDGSWHIVQQLFCPSADSSPATDGSPREP